MTGFTFNSRLFTVFDTDEVEYIRQEERTKPDNNDKEETLGLRCMWSHKVLTIVGFRERSRQNKEKNFKGNTKSHLLKETDRSSGDWKKST